MVYYFTSNVVEPAAYIYMGKDKVENEELIKYGWDEDIWYMTLSRPLTFTKLSLLLRFHADKLSSAHIYLRLKEGQSWEDISPELLVDCCQLTKANSIEGNKKDNVNIVYTPWSNLKKDGSMAVGQVGFKDQRKVKKVLVEARTNAIINRLNKNKTEKFPDLAAEREERDKAIRNREKKLMLERKKEEARVMKERREKAWQKDHAYDDVFTEDALEENTNDKRDANFYDDFM